MKTLDIQAALRDVPLFAELNETELAQLAQVCKTRLVTKGNVIFYEDDPGTSAYVIVSGQVKITHGAEDGREHIIGMLGEGDLFGEMSLIDGRPRSASAVSVDNVRILMIQRDEFLALLNANAAMTLKLLQALSLRLRAAGRNMSALAFLSAPGRIAKLLLDFGRELGEPTPEGLSFRCALSRMELASLAGTSRETVTRTLMEYQDRGFIAVDKNQITLRNEAKLEAMVV